MPAMANGNILNEMLDRRSVRKYKPDAVSDEDVLRVLEAARLAPSGSNTQPWRFIVIRDPETKKKLARADHDQSWMLTAPVFIACLADISCRLDTAGLPELSEDCPLPELKQVIRDSSITITQLMLEAEHLGLSTCWTGWYEQNEMKKALKLPREVYVCGIITLGYGAEQPAPRPRKPLDEIVRYEKW